MKQLFNIVVILTLFTSCCSTKNTMKVLKDVDLDSVVTMVQHQYKQALDTLEKEGIKNISISGAELTLKITQAISGNGEIKIIVKASKKYIQTKSTSVTFVLSENKDKTGGGGYQPLTLNLRDIIIQAARQFNSLTATVGSLTKDNFVVDIDFSIERDTSGGLEFEIWGVSVDAGGEVDNTVEHELKLTFTVQKPKAK